MRAQDSEAVAAPIGYWMGMRHHTYAFPIVLLALRLVEVLLPTKQDTQSHTNKVEKPLIDQYWTRGMAIPFA